MTVGSTPSKSSIISSLNGKLAGNNAMQGQGGTLVRKLMSGANLSAAQSDIAETTGLGRAVAQLMVAEGTAQMAPAGPLQMVDYVKVAVQTRAVMQKANEANSVYAQNHAGYNKVYQGYQKSALGQANTKAQPFEDHFFNAMADSATVAGLGLSAWALPSFIKQIGASSKAISTDFANPQATNNQKLTDVGDVAKASSGTIYSAQGVVLGAKGTVAIMARNATMGKVIGAIGQSPISKFIASPFNKVLGVLLPVADAGMLVEDAVVERQTLKSSTATTKDKAVATLNLGLATLKMAFWVFPEVPVLRTIYSAASFAQLGLAIAGLWNQLKPSFIKTVQTIGWGIVHPIQGAKALGAATVRGIDKIGQGLLWVGDRLIHPIKTIESIGHWFAALFSGIASLITHRPTATQPAKPATASVMSVNSLSAQAAPYQAPAQTYRAAPSIPNAPQVVPVPTAAPIYTQVPTASRSPVTQAASTQVAFQAALGQLAPSTPQATAQTSTSQSYQAAMAQINSMAPTP
jgi:hypothetical protein